MSMIGNLLRVSSSELEQYLADSALLEERVYPEEWTEDPYLLDLDKAWENIYFLLTGCTSDNFEKAEAPLSLIFFNSDVIDDQQDMGYGPANYCTPTEVKAIAAALPDADKEMLRRKFEALKSPDTVLYPFVPDSEDMFDYIFDYYSEMKDFYEEAAKSGQAVISFIN